MIDYLVFDIETIPTQSRVVKDFIAKTIKPPATIKLETSIKKWHENDKESAIADSINKTGLDGAFGQVVCVGYDLIEKGEKGVISSLDEAVVLNEYNNVLNKIPHNHWSSICTVGHNISGFDLRFLLQRYIVNQIKPHPIIFRASYAKPWEATIIYDTMIQFAGTGGRISLDKLCVALGLEGKGDIDGSMVAKMVADGRLDEVAQYCASDVSKTRSVFERMTFRK